MNNQDDTSSTKTPRSSLDSNSMNSKKNNLIVQGPDGNTILCDSPQPSHLPYYTGPDQSTTSSTTKATNVTPPSSWVPEHDSNGETPITSPPSPNSSAHPQHRSVRRVKPRRVIGNYSLVSTLGSGSMGKVRLAINELNQDKLAVKIVPRVGTQDRTINETDEAAVKKKREKDQHRETRTIREASIMLLLHHPYIVSLKEMVVLDPYYYMFMEYVDGGQLLDFIISHGKLKERHARRFARQIVSALDYCHRNSIVHRDLKIENILISRNGHIKIIDFGLSNLFSPRSHLSTFCGSLYFAAPELLNAKAYTGPEVDVWSFGVVLYVLVCGKVPFDDQNMAALHDKIKRGVVDYPSHLTSECKNILSRMLVVNPSHRATTAEITVHPWMNKGHSEPVNNYLPEREPLTLPVDMEVVRGMTGFEFGSEEEIKSQLEEIIQSDEYQKAVATLIERQSFRHHPHRSSLSRKHQSFCLPNDDPQSIPAAYHPLISIYYLVREHMKREDQQATNKENIDYLTASSRKSRSISPRSSHRERLGCHSTKASDTMDTTTQQRKHNDTSSTAIQQSTIIPMPEAAHAPPSSTTQKDLSPFDDDSASLSKGVSYGEKGKINIQVDGEGQITDTGPNQSTEEPYHGFGRLFNWHHHRRSGGSDDEHEHNDTLNALQQLTQVVTRSSFEKRQRRQRRHTIDDKTPAGNLTDLMPTSSTSSGNEPTGDGHRMESRQPNPLTINTNHHNHDGASLSAGTKRLGRTFSKMLSRKSMPSTDHDPPPSSGSTTLDRHHGFGHRFSKSKSLHSGGVGMGEQHVHEQSFPTNIGGTLNQNQGTADEQVKPVFLKGLFSVSTTSTKHPSVIRADLIRVLERIGVKWRESKSRFECVHVPSIDMNKVTHSQHLTPSVHDAPTSSLSFSPPSSTLQSNAAVTVPDLVVRFEISIVKVPWLLGMHGLQFRRVSGDTWQYKNMCSRILAELKL